MKKRNFLIGIILTAAVVGITYFFIQNNEKATYVNVPTDKIESKQKVVKFNTTQPKLNKIQKTKVIKTLLIKRSVASSGKRPARSLSSTFKSIKNKTQKEISELRKLSQSQFIGDDGVEFFNGLFAESVKRKEEPIKTFGGFYIYDTPFKENNIGIAIKDGRIGVLSGEIFFQTRNIDALEDKIRNYSTQQVMIDKNIGIYIIQVDDYESYKNILTDQNLSKFKPKPDIIFDYNLPR